MSTSWKMTVKDWAVAGRRGRHFLFYREYLKLLFLLASDPEAMLMYNRRRGFE